MERTSGDAPRDRRIGTLRETVELAIAAARAAQDKKATDGLVLDVGPILTIADMFVIVSTTNPRQLVTVADEVVRRLKDEFGRSPISVEGREDPSWVLLDYGDIVVHVFLEETRRYYSLERLWGDAEQIEWEDPQAAAI